MKKVFIASTVKSYPRTLPYFEAKQKILGANYSLSLIFIGSTRARNLNQDYRGKSYVPNVLSFPLNEQTGEIYICPEVAKREAKKFELTKNGYLFYLFIHGLLHLKGYQHGDTMSKLEKKYVEYFKVK